MKPWLKNSLLLHIGLLFIATSGWFGRSVDLPVPVVIAWRALIGAICLSAFLFITKTSFKIEKEHRLLVFGSSIFMIGHWLLYFYSLSYSNIPIAMISVFTYPLMTVILEPILLKTKFDRNLIFIGIIMIIGLWVMTPEMSLENKFTLGVICGVASALSYTFRNLIMKSLIDKYDASILMCRQTLWAALLLLPMFFLHSDIQPQEDWPWILGLGVITTATGHTMFAKSFKNISISAASITSMIQPLYGIGLGIIFLSEIPDVSTAIGGAIILSGLLLQTLLKRKKARISDP